MSEKKLNTIIVLRNDHGDDVKFGSADSTVVLQPGEVGVHYLDNGNIVVKAGDGQKSWDQLKQIEGVFEQPVTLTQNFGYFTGVPTGGYKTFDGSNGTVNTQGMTTSEFLMQALKQSINPTVVQPNASMTASVANTGAELEVGSYITKINWDGSSSNGTYKVGSGSDQGTGITANSFTWAVSNKVDSQTSNKMDSSFDITANKKQITSTSETGYVTVEAKVTLDTSSAKNPKNNLGEDVSSLKITNATVSANGFTVPEGGTNPVKDLSATAKATGFHKPFWAVKAAAADLKKPTAYTSSDVRGLANSANSTKGFPTSLAVPVGSEQVVFFARAGAYSSLVATDDNAMNAGVTFTKVANALKVKGNNEYAPEGTDGFDYDLWYVDWNPDSAAGYAGIGSAKQLTLKWS